MVSNTIEKETESSESMESSLHDEMDGLENLLKSILLRRWEPSEEWQLVDVVNERFTSEPESSSETTVIRTSFRTTGFTPETSCTTTMEVLGQKSQPTVFASREQGLRALSSWLSENRRPGDRRIWEKLDQYSLQRPVPSEFDEFLSRGYLKISVLKSLGRPKHLGWNKLYQPANLKPFFDLWDQIEMPQGKKPKKRKSAHTEVVAPRFADFLKNLWCDPVDLSKPQGEEEPEEESKTELSSPKRIHLIQKGHDGSWEPSANLTLAKIHVKFPSSVQMAPYALLCPLLSPLSLSPGTMFFWSRAFFEYNLLAALPRLDWRHVRPKGRRRASQYPVLAGYTNVSRTRTSMKLIKPKETDVEMTNLAVLHPAILPTEATEPLNAHEPSTVDLQLEKVKHDSRTQPYPNQNRKVKSKSFRKAKCSASKTISGCKMKRAEKKSDKPTTIKPRAELKKIQGTTLEYHDAIEGSSGQKTKVKHKRLMNSDWPLIPTERQAAIATRKELQVSQQP